MTAVTLHLGYFLSGMLFVGGDLHPGDRLLALPLERDLRLLVCLRHHPPAGGLVRRLDGQAHQPPAVWAGARVPSALAFALLIVAFVVYLDVTRKDVQRAGAVDLATSRTTAQRRPGRAVAAQRSRGLAVRILVWLAVLVAATAVAFLVGYLIGPHFVAHVL